MVDAIARIEQYVAGFSYETFATDQKTIDAVVRNLEIIGEAARSIPAAMRDRYPHIPWTVMFGMRNALAHVYFRVSLPVVWDTIEQDLPPLKAMLQELLDQEGT